MISAETRYPAFLRTNMILSSIGRFGLWLRPVTFSSKATGGLLRTMYFSEWSMTTPLLSERAFFLPTDENAGQGAPLTNKSTVGIVSYWRSLISPMIRGLCPNFACMIVIILILSGQISEQKRGLMSQPRSFNARKSDPSPQQSDPSRISSPWRWYSIALSGSWSESSTSSENNSSATS